MHIEPFIHEAYKKEWTKYEDLKEIFQHPKGQDHEEDDDNKVNYFLQDGLLYKLGKLCVPKGERIQLIKEGRMFKVTGLFCAREIVIKLQRYV